MKDWSGIKVGDTLICVETPARFERVVVGLTPKGVPILEDTIGREYILDLPGAWELKPRTRTIWVSSVYITDMHGTVFTSYYSSKEKAIMWVDDLRRLYPGCIHLHTLEYKVPILPCG